MFPDKALPEWIKDFQCENWTDVCRAKDAIRIAWEALSAYENDEIGTAKEALEKIRALGDK